MIESILEELAKLGTEQNRKIYMRHGSGAKTFGVSFANLNLIAKRLKRNHPLALELWKSGISDAQALATMIVVPSLLTKDVVESWLDEADYSVLRGLVAGNVAHASFCDIALKEWPFSKRASLQEAGFSLVCHALKAGVSIDVDHLRGLLNVIVRKIHHSPNQVRAAMNHALIAIGIYEDSLLNKALDVAKTIGTVEVDHGETSCKTPDAYSYIQKAITRKKKLRGKESGHAKGKILP